MSFFAILQFPALLRASIFAFAVVAAASQNVPSSSPIASTDLICHTDIITDCYPAVFSPTKHFQIIHNDQSVPPGLHIRMNLATGLKEARLNVAEPEIEKETAIIVIDENHGLQDLTDHTVRKPAAKKQFVVQDKGEPRRSWGLPVNDPSVTKADDEDLTAVLDRVSSAFEGKIWGDLPHDMEDLIVDSYDIELGAVMTADRRFTGHLLHAIEHGTDHVWLGGGPEPAVMILGGALHNNPAALQSLMDNEGQKDRSPVVIALESLHFPGTHGHNERELYRANRLIFLLFQLCQNSQELDKFLARDGLDLLVRWQAAPPAEDCEFDKGQLRKRIANFLADLAPAISEAISRGKGTKSQLVRACETFKIDPSVRYDTTSVDYTSAKAAGEALQEVLGGECSE